MGISHEYHSTRSHGRRGGAGGKLRLLGVIAAILILSLAITAILESGQRANTDMVDTLRDAAPFVRIVGDCVRPANITQAVYQGYHAALDI